MVSAGERGAEPHRSLVPGRRTAIGARRTLGRVMAVSTELDRAVDQRLAEHDLRYTSGRRQIVKGLQGAGGPVTLPELLVITSGLAQSSAYRNLSLMEEAGVVRRLVHGGDHAHYELAEELTEHHHHLICESCGQVRDFTLSTPIERTLDATSPTSPRPRGSAPATT